MTIAALRRRLADEGCNPALYAIGTRGAASDAYCLTFDGQRWNVYYTERGHDSPPEFSSPDEMQACAFFFKRVMRLRHHHLVGFFKAEEAARSMHDRLAAAGIDAFLERIPYGGPANPRFRVFVTGKAVFAARDLLGAIPIREAGS